MAHSSPQRPTVAVVGTGSIGRRHLAVLLELGCAAPIAVSEHGRLERLDVSGREIEVAHSLTDVVGNVDAVIVASPTAAHLGHLETAVHAGCHVLVEKPVATTSVGLDAVATLAEARGLVAAAGHQFRYEPGLLAIRELVLEGALGVLLAVEAHQGEHLADYHPAEDYRIGYAARSDLGGGVLRTQIHHIDVLDWIFGPLERVYASGGHLSDLEIDVEDSASYLFRSTTGTSVYGHLDYRQRPRTVTLRAVGTDGRVEWDHYAARLVHTPSGGEPIIKSWPYDRQSMFRAQMSDFLDAVAGTGTVGTPLRDGIRAVHLVEAIESSSALDRSVAVAGVSEDERDG
ncbi:MAG: Gfo/Idh/MocA family oxidoreductase [Acidimicrobiia bacterium]|nr:Gfo/Idh/MocA family oxidoreductase [Acidimicrobiia bacterium]